MNLQRRNVSSKRPGSRKREQKSWAFKFYVLIYLLVVATLLFGALNYRIDLNRKITELQQAGHRAEREIVEFERDIQSLRIARERLSSWENVSRRIAEYDLPLRAAEPGQIRYIADGRMITPGELQSNSTVHGDIAVSAVRR